MSRFQQLALLILALILVAVIALVAVTATRPQTIISVTQTLPLSVRDMTNTRNAVIYQTAVSQMTATQLASRPNS